MEITALQHAHEALLEIANAGRFEKPSPGDWGAERILAHVIATNRMIAAATAELLAGRTPVMDNRPTQSAAYLDAIADAAGSWAEFLRALDGSNREVLALAAQLTEAQLAVKVPAIFVDGGVIRVERPIPFSLVVGTGHIDGHAQQLRSLAT